MRLSATLFICLFLLAAGVLCFGGGPAVRASAIQSDDPPKILNAKVKGKKLIVTGQNFAPGAVILVDGEPQKTKNDPAFPTTMLIAKTAGKKIPNNTAVSLQIQSDGSTSDRFGMFKGRVVTLADVEKTILLNTGDRFLLFVSKGGYEFSPSVLDTTVLQKIDDVEIIAGSQGIFEAKREGSTKLSVIGELPCQKTNPPCLAPTVSFEFNIVVANFKLEN
jgi:hypothetical protein